MLHFYNNSSRLVSIVYGERNYMEHDGARTSCQCELLRATRESDPAITFFVLPLMCCDPSDDLDSDDSSFRQS